MARRYAETDDTTPEEYNGPVCSYCGEPAPDDNDTHHPYCSALCACYAERDNLEDRL